MACTCGGTSSSPNLNLGQVQAVTQQPLLSTNVNISGVSYITAQTEALQFVYTPAKIRSLYEFQSK
jgi:hypothetical protein